MPLQMPVLVDPWRLVDLGKRFSGHVALRAFPRLASYLQNRSGEAVFELSFGKDEQARPVVSGSCQALLKLTCQRCLAEMEYPVDTAISLALVASLGEARELPGHLDPLLVEEPQVKLLDILEDELLLALPDVPMHDASSCAGAQWVDGDAGSQQSDEERLAAGPFAELAKLKQKRTS